MTNAGRTFFLVCLLGAGCSAPNVNPPAPKANRGYVDFYTDSDLNLSWRIKQGSATGTKLRPLFTEVKPLRGNILRLASPAGTYRFEVWFNNQVTSGPQTVLVQVANEKVTPVHVTIASAGSLSVSTRSYEYRPTARATRRVTRVGEQDQEVFDIGAVPGTAQDYRPKEGMPYFRPSRSD